VSYWIGGGEAAEIIGVSRTSIYKSLRDPDVRAAKWGAEGVGWRYKPLVDRAIYQVSRIRAEEIATESRVDR
jgi:hypothetical protein